VEFRILGSVEARAEGRALELGGSRQRALLALLLLSRGAPVSRDRLLEDLWGEEEPKSGVKALQVAVSRLRRALGDHERQQHRCRGARRLEQGRGRLQRA
jgi:DNA-binding SARP family transcriptional activator